jgi:PAS domain S-box-containing protein
VTPFARRLSSLLVPLVAVVAAAVTLALWWHERESERSRLHATFDSDVRQTALRVEQRVANYEQMVRGLQGLFAAGGGRVDAAAFDRYVARVMEGPDALGLQRFGYNAFVPAAGLAAHVAARRAAGDAGYVLTPAGDRPVYGPLTYIAPASDDNLTAMGYDSMSEPVRANAMFQARDSGTLAMTGRLVLRVDQGRPAAPGFIMYLPVYAGSEPPGTLAERRERLLGWVSAGFRVADMMSSLYGEAPSGLEVRLHDGTSTGNQTLMYRSDARARGADSPDARLALPQFDAQEYIAFGGRTWTLRVRALPDFVERHQRDTSSVILVAGAVLSLLLGLVVRQLVTQRQGAHEVAQAMTLELRASEARYRRMIETASEGIWIIDDRHRIAFANPQIARWLEVADRDMAGRAIDDFMDPADAARLRAALARARGERRDTLEVALRRRDGSTTWAALSFRTIVEDDGRDAGALCMLTDISARRGAEERRAALEGQLRESQKMEAIGTLAGGIAHDFNNILAAIIGNVATARFDAAEGRPGVESALVQIHRAAVRARSLVQQILTFSRMQSPVLLAQPLQPIVDEALQILRATLPPSVQLVVRLPDEPVHVLADGTQLQQVVMNLATNAWHALREGRGRIEVGVGLADSAVAPGCAHLWVVDDGMGMDDATRARIFEPFFTTKPVGRGTGLGLAVVHGIVSGHGGRIVVDSAPGCGSRFDLYLPLAAAPAEASMVGVPEVDPPRGQGQRVACVDDDPAMLLMVQALLERAGYRVTPFDRPEDALAAVPSADPAYDLVVTDYTMPGMNGIDLAGALARLAPDLPVVITSGFISDELREVAQARGVRALLQKEFTHERLAALVHEVLAERVER